MIMKVAHANRLVLFLGWLFLCWVAWPLSPARYTAVLLVVTLMLLVVAFGFASHEDETW